MIGIIKKIFGTKYDRDVKKYNPIVEEINEYFKEYGSLSNDELRNKTIEFKERITDHLKDIDAEINELKENANTEEDILVKEEIYDAIDELIKERDENLEVVLNQILPEAFAVVKETSRRFAENDFLEVKATQHDRDLAAVRPNITIEGDNAVWANKWLAAGGEIKWNMVHYDVQLIGGMVLHDGKIAEMTTGEGKTLVASLPLYLNALAGQGSHLVTVNDYLARRDSEWIGPIFEFLFLTVDCIDKHKPHSDARKNAYNCDITYGTNNEFGFDYLRDNMVVSEDEMVQRKLHFAIVDEVDSVLIDDARTPLIISGPVEAGEEEELYNILKPKIEKLIAVQKQLATGYLATAKKLIAEGNTGSEEGGGGLALLRAYRALPKYRPLIKYLSQEGIKVLLQKTENIYMQEQSKRMPEADAPLYFTIDEKNRQVELTDKGAEFLAKGEADPNLFVIPDIASIMQEIEADEEMSEEEKQEAREKESRDFSNKSKSLHAVNQLLKAYTLFEKDDEYVVMDGEVKIVDEQTGRMMEGRRYSDGLHQAIEAKENVKVGEITQTYATVTLQNFFRMYHKLSGMTGTAETEAGEFWEIYKLDVVVIPTNRPIIREDKEDLVYKTEREKFHSVIQEIKKMVEQGRPSLVGTTSVDISEKLSRMLSMQNINHNVLNAKHHQREAEIVAEAGQPGKVTIATNMAGRGTDIKITEEVKKAGGLAIIATERHESRRVDNQLRGRAGRQGDPGSSQFFVSLEDNLMRLFNSERIAKLMDKMGHKEGDVIQHSMVTKSIERAQKKVEENNFGIRKRLLEYDDVMNIQREAIYKKRKNALSGERLAVDLYNMFADLTETIVVGAKQIKDYNAFKIEVFRIFGVTSKIDEDTFAKGNEEELSKQLLEDVFEHYHAKHEKFTRILLPVIKDVYANEGDKYKKISIPFTDGRPNPYPVAASLEDAVNSDGESVKLDIEKTVTLSIIDHNWKEHLRSMDELKDSVQAASFEQKDPLVIYKLEAYNLFEHLVYKINEEVLSYLMKGKLIVEGRELEEAKIQHTDMSRTQTSREERAAKAAAANAGGRQVIETVKRDAPKVGRNDLCPCGSGKKYKHCHGRF